MGIKSTTIKTTYTAAWKEKNWSGLNDIVVGKCINKRVQCVNNLLKCYVRLSVMQTEIIENSGFFTTPEDLLYSSNH